MAQVQARLEERSDIFYSLLMSILASTLAQVSLLHGSADTSGSEELGASRKPSCRQTCRAMSSRIPRRLHAIVRPSIA